MEPEEKASQQVQHRDEIVLTCWLLDMSTAEETQQQQPPPEQPAHHRHNHEAKEGRIQLVEDAPTVNLSLFVIKNLGLEVSHDTEQGRVVVATREFTQNEIGHVILREAPALICKQQDYLDFIETFLDLPVEVQVGILDLYYQPLDSPLGQALIEPSQLLYMLGVLEDVTVIHQLLAIYMTNAHQYQQTNSAITLFGSKFSHSCHPNVGYSSTSPDGFMEYHLLRPIQAGEQVTFSYLADLYETPTNERRHLLQNTKSFICQCPRCLAPDYSRCIQCPTCSDTNNYVPCQYNNISDNNYDDPYWECFNGCGVIETSHMLQTEQVMSNLLRTIESDIKQKVGGVVVDGDVDENNVFNLNTVTQERSQFNPQMLQHIIDKCQSSLSYTHHLTIKSLRLKVNVTTNYAYVQTSHLIQRGLLQVPQYSSRIHTLIRSGIDAGFQLVLACECVAANCTGCYFDSHYDDDSSSSPNKQEKNDDNANQSSYLRLHVRHEPNYDRATTMNHFLEDLWQLPLYWWPPLAFTMMERYYPLLKQKFHDHLLDVRLGYCLSNFHHATVCRECDDVDSSYWEDPKWID